MLRNLASSLFLTERDDEYYEQVSGIYGTTVNPPATKGRVVTTVEKAKEVRSLVEKCITIARRSLAAQQNAEQFATDAERGSAEWKSWRNSDQWQQWNAAIAPAVAARRRALQMLGDKEAVQILFEDIGPRFADRDGGYTRVVRLAKPRLGDAGQRALLELVGVRDRVAQRSQKPSFSDDEPEVEAEADQLMADETELADETEPSAEADAADESVADEEETETDKQDA